MPWRFFLSVWFQTDMFDSEILSPWSFLTFWNGLPGIGRHLCIKMWFWHFSTHKIYVTVRGKLSEPHFVASFFSNPGEKVRKRHGIRIWEWNIDRCRIDKQKGGLIFSSFSFNGWPNGCIDKYMDGRIDRRIDALTERSLKRQLNRQLDGFANWWMDGWMDGWMDNWQWDGRTEGWTDRRTEGWM